MRYPSLIGATCLLAMLQGCSLFPRNIEPPESVFSDTQLLPAAKPSSQAATDVPTFAASLERDLVRAWVALDNATASNESVLSRNLLLKGISVVDARCDAYFRALGLAAQKQAFGQRELGLTTGVVAALQGLTGVATKDIAITGSALGFIGASSAAYGDVFIFSPQVSSVQALVAAGQSAVKLKIDELGVEDFSKAQAIFLLQEYEKTCEVHTVRRLVNESLAAAKPVVSSATDEGLSAVLDKSTRAQLAALLKVDMLSDAELYSLYGFGYKPSASSATQAQLALQLGRFNDLVDGAGKLRSEAELGKIRAAVRAVFAPLVAMAPSAARLEAGLASIQAQTVTEGQPTPRSTPAPAAATARSSVRAFSSTLTVRVLPGR